MNLCSNLEIDAETNASPLILIGRLEQTFKSTDPALDNLVSQVNEKIHRAVPLVKKDKRHQITDQDILDWLRVILAYAEKGMSKRERVTNILTDISDSKDVIKYLRIQSQYIKDVMATCRMTVGRGVALDWLRGNVFGLVEPRRNPKSVEELCNLTEQEKLAALKELEQWLKEEKLTTSPHIEELETLSLVEDRQKKNVDHGAHFARGKHDAIVKGEEDLFYALNFFKSSGLYPRRVVTPRLARLKKHIEEQAKRLHTRSLPKQAPGFLALTNIGDLMSVEKLNDETLNFSFYLDQHIFPDQDAFQFEFPQTMQGNERVSYIVAENAVARDLHGQMNKTAKELFKPVLVRDNNIVREKVKKWATSNECKKFYDPTYVISAEEQNLFDTCNELLHKAQIKEQELETSSGSHAKNNSPVETRALLQEIAGAPLTLF